MSDKLKTTLKIAAPALASILGLVTLRLLGPDIVSQQTLAEWIRPFGEWAPLAFILFLAVRPITLLPGQLFTAVGGLLFGTKAGFVYAIIGSALANALVFFLAKNVGSRFMKRIAKHKYGAIKEVARRHDLGFAVVTCINPLVPSDVAIATAAAAGARFWPTALGFLLGTVPGTFLTAQFGSALGQGKTVMTILSAAGILVSLLLGVILGRRMLRDLNEATTSKPAHTPPAAQAA
jgi:uncharacterized membrane protein YdjX (TVP38/TMEM64 family)